VVFCPRCDVLNRIIGANPVRHPPYIAVRGVQGKEIKVNDNLRIAPAGNRTGGVGELPHYHRRIVGPDGKTVPGGGIGWHRPWEP